MSSINGIPIDYIHGRGQDFRQRTVITRENGVTGYYSQLLGGSDANFEFRLVEFREASDIFDFVAFIESLQGTIADVINDHGERYQYVLVTEVDQARVEPAGLYPNLTNPRVARLAIRGVRLQANDAP